MSNEPPVHPLDRLKQKAEEINERRKKERVYCPECGTEVLKESIEDAVETAETHDEKRHDGERTTKVNGLLLPSRKTVEAAQEFVEKLGLSDDGDGGDQA